ncbi:MAG: sporulation protein YqfD [Clostridia bacterium]|nr:sporulation protein YqfD [Clostridia bacterium]
MEFGNRLKHVRGIVIVQIEGYFTERFINLCKINNVKIWDIRNIVNGMIRFKIDISEFKKLKPIAKKTKCSVKIKEKEGLYFTFHKYRKRKIFLILTLVLLIVSIIFSTFIWNIEITGNTYISKEELMSALKDSGVYIGKNKNFIDNKDVTNNMRVLIPDLAWIGFEMDGTKAIVKVVEKTKIAEKDIQESACGNIVADKSGIITKIIPENGTALLKTGSYAEEGNILIEGVIYSKLMEPEYVTAKGIVRINKEYYFSKEYYFENTIKNFSNKIRYSIGVTIDYKEYMINYLNKSLKYDISKKSKKISLFGKVISFDLYQFNEYSQSCITKSKEEILEEAKVDGKNYIENEILPNTNLGNIVDSVIETEEIENGLIVNIKYTINEQIGKFVERTN